MEQALAKLTEAIIANPQDLSQLDEYCDSYLNDERVEELLQVFEALTPELKEHKEALAAVMNKAADAALLFNLEQRAEHYFRAAAEAVSSNVTALCGLRKIYQGWGDISRAALLYEKELVNQPEEAERLQGYLELGHIYMDQLEDLEKAQHAFNQALKLDPQNANAIDALASVAISREDWVLAVSYLEKTLIVEGPSSELEGRIIKVLTQLAARPITHQLAVKLATAAKDNGLDSAEIAAINDSLAQEAANWTEKVTALGNGANELLEQDPAAAAEQYVLVAEYLVVYGNDLNAAQEWLDSSLLIWPAMPRALKVLERLFSEAGRFEELASKLESMAAIAPTGTAAISLYKRAAAIYGEKLNNEAAKVAIYNKILQIEPADEAAAEVVISAYRTAGQWNECLGMLAWLAQRTGTAADRVKKFEEICQILEEQLQDKERAIPYYQHILSLDHHNVKAARALVDTFRNSGAAADLARCLSTLAQAASGDERVAYLQELAALYIDQLNDRRKAVGILSLLIKEQPTGENIARLQAAAETSDELALAANGLKEAIKETADQTARIDLMLALAKCFEQAETPWAAADIYQEILSIDPENAVAKEQCGLGNKGTVEIEAVTMEHIAAAESAEDKITALLDAAKNARIDRPEKALDFLNQAFALDSTKIETITALVEVLARLKRLPALADMQEKLCALLGGDELIAQRRALASTLEKLDNRKRAAAVYMDILQELHGDAECMAALERLLAGGGETALIAKTLRPLYQEKGEWQKLADIDDLLVSQEKNNQGRLELLLEMADTWDQQLGDAKKAIEILARALKLAPERQDIQSRLEATAAECGVEGYQAVVAVYGELARALPPQKAQSLWLEVGEMASLRLNNLELAASALVSAFTSAPRDEKVQSAMKVLFTASSKDLLLNTVATAWAGKDAKFTKLLYKNLARASETGDSVELSMAIWGKVGELDPADSEVAKANQRLAEASGDNQTIADNLRERLASATGNTRMELVLRLADLQINELNQVAEAAQLLEAEKGENPSKEILARLATCYHNLGNNDLLLPVLTARVSLLGAGDERNNALVELATVEHSLGQEETAIGHLEEVLNIKVLDSAVTLLEQLLANLGPALKERATKLLAEAYANSGRFEDAVVTFEELANNAAEVADRLAVLHRIADIQQGKMQDKGAAFATLLKIFTEDPKDTTLRKELETLAAEADTWSELVTAYQAAITTLEGEVAATVIARRVAEILEQKLGRSEEAIQYYKISGGNNGALPDDLAALQAMEKLLRSQNNAIDLAAVLEKIATLLPENDKRRRKEALVESAKLYAETLNDLATAATVYERALELDGRDKEVLAAVDDIYVQLADWQKLADHLTRRIEAAGIGPEVVDLHLRRAKLMLDEFNDPQTALGHYKTVLVKKRNHEGAVAGLEEILPLVENKGEIVQILEPIYTSAQNNEKLAWILEIHLGLVEEAAQRKSLLRRIGDIYDSKLEKKAEAFTYARRAMAADPNDMGIQMWVAKLADQTGNYGDLADAYVEEAPNVDEKMALRFHRNAAALYHEKLADFPAAVEEYRAIIAADPKDEKALASLESIFRQQENYADLAGVLRRRADQTVGLERKREILSELGGIYADRLSDGQNAIATFKEVLTAAPDDLKSFERVETIMSANGLWEDLSAFYDAEITRLAAKRGVEPRARRQELMLRRARVLDVSIGEFETATALLTDILKDNPEHTATWDYCEQRIGAKVATEATIALLEQVYQAQEQWEKYIAILETKLQVQASQEERPLIYKEMATVILDKLGQSERSYMTLCRAFDEDRSAIQVREMLEDLTEKLNKYEDLSEIYADSLDSLVDPDLRQKTIIKLAKIADEKLHENDQAISWYEKALENTPKDVDLLANIDRLLVATENWQRLTEILDAEIENTLEKEPRVALLLRLAVVWNENLCEDEAGVRCYKQILELDPDQAEALKAIGVIYEEQSKYEELADVLRHQAEVLTDPEEQYAIHKRLAELAAEEFSDYGDSIEHWNKVLAIKPDDEAAQTSLEFLLRGEERLEELVTLYQQMLSIKSDAGEKAEIHSKLGDILEKLGRTGDALTSWEEVLATEPKNLEALRALQPLYLERALFEKFEQVAKVALPLVEAEEAQTIRLNLARVVGVELGRTEEGILLAKDYLHAEQADPAQLEQLGEVLEKLESWTDAAQAYGKAAEILTEEDQLIDLYLKAANICRDQLQNERKSVEYLESLRECKPEHVEAFNRLRAIYKEEALWRKLVALDDDFVQYAGDEEAYGLLCEIRDTQSEQLGEKDIAFITACRAFKARPGLAEPAAALEELAVATEAVEEAVAIMEESVTAVEDLVARVELWRRIAVIYADRLNDIPAAENALKELRQVEPSDIGALDMLAALAAREERFDKQLEAMEIKLSLATELEAKKALLYDEARIYEDSVGDEDGALSTYRRVLEYDPQDRTSLEQMQRIYTASEEWEPLVETLSKLVAISQDMEELVELELRVARILENQLERHDDAINWYNSVLELAPGHSEALSALENIYTSLERWRELVQVYELELQVTTEVEAQVAIMSKVALIYENQFESAQDAVYVYERILDIDSTNLKAFAAIERLLRTIGEWNKLIDFLQRHIALLEANDEKVALYLQIAEIYYQELKLVNKAEETYNLAYQMDSTNADAILALSQLYERSGNWFAALDMLQKGADVLGKNRKAVRLLFRMGRINQDMLWDSNTAKSCFLRALEIDDTHMASLAALKDIAYSEKDWDHYIEYLIAEAENCDDEEEQCELYFETAEFFRTTKMEEDQAASFYEKALAVDANYLPAANPLAEICFKKEQWERARDLYLLAISGLDAGKDARELSQKHYRLGYVFEKLQDNDSALVHYQKAVDSDSTYLPALEGLSQALLNAEAWEEATKVFQAMLIHHRDSLTESEVVEIQYQLGELFRKMRQNDRAQKEFDKALKIDPDHPQTLESMAEIAQEEERNEDAYTRLAHLVEVLPLHDRVEILIKMATIAQDNLEDQGRAIWSLENARQITPENGAVIEPLAKLYEVQQQIPQAVALYEQLVAQMVPGEKARDLHYLLGTLYKGPMNSAPKAVQHFNAALDSDVSFMKAFEEIEQILVSCKQWGILEENYRRMIERMPRTLVAARTWLWRRLGDLYRQVLNNLDGAIMAYEVVTKMSPDTKEDAEVLASLYAQKPEHRGEAIHIQHEALQQDPNPVPHIRELFNLYKADQNWDGVYVMSTALMALGQGNQEEQQTFQYLSKAANFKVSAGLSEQMWDELVNLPSLRCPISQISAQLLKIALNEVSFDLKDLGLKKNMKLDLRSSMLPQAANVFKTTARLLDLDHLEFYIRPTADDMQLTPTNPASIAIGQNNEMMVVSDRRLNFHLAREMFFGKPEFYMARVFSGEKLADVLFGIIMAASGNNTMEHNGNPREVDRWAKHFSKIQQYLRSYTDLLRQVYAQLLTPGSREAYQRDLELTACRVGFIFGGSLDVAMKALQDVRNPVAKIDLRDRQKHLLLYSCTPEYLKVRQAVGINLKINRQ